MVKGVGLLVIWFFLAGMIAGAVGMIMLAGWWVRKHIKKVTAEEMEDELRKVRTAESNGADCDEGRKVPEQSRNNDAEQFRMGSASEQCMADAEQTGSTGDR